MCKVCVNGISCRAVAGMIGRPQKKSQQVKLCCAEFHSGGSRVAAVAAAVAACLWHLSEIFPKYSSSSTPVPMPECRPLTGRSTGTVLFVVPATFVRPHV